MKTGLVIEGGGVRGIYAAGVLDAFMEQGLKFDGVIGVSAGAIHGCSYLSGQKGRSIRYYMKYCNDPRFMSVRSWITTGDMQDQIDYLRASASLPYFSRIVELNDKKYLDGGTTDSIPVEAFEAMGYGRNVLILTRDVTYRKKPEMRLLAKLRYRKYPAFVNALRNRHVSYNETVDKILEKEKQGKVFVIRPSEPLNIGRMEKDSANVKRVYDIGYADACKKMEELKKWLMPMTGKSSVIL